jgi:hypothetical protein
MRLNVFRMLAILPISFGAIAGGTQTGQVSQLLVRQSDGLTYFVLSGPAGGKPSCALQSYWMIHDENSAAGKKLLAMLMIAQASGRAVTVFGSGTCARWPDGEDVDTLLLSSQ